VSLTTAAASFHISNGVGLTTILPVLGSITLFLIATVKASSNLAASPKN